MLRLYVAHYFILRIHYEYLVRCCNNCLLLASKCSFIRVRDITLYGRHRMYNTYIRGTAVVVWFDPLTQRSDFFF